MRFGEMTPAGLWKAHYHLCDSSACYESGFNELNAVYIYNPASVSISVHRPNVRSERTPTSSFHPTTPRELTRSHYCSSFLISVFTVVHVLESFICLSHIFYFIYFSAFCDALWTALTFMKAAMRKKKKRKKKNVRHFLNAPKRSFQTWILSLGSLQWADRFPKSVCVCMLVTEFEILAHILQRSYLHAHSPDRVSLCGQPLG